MSPDLRTATDSVQSEDEVSTLRQKVVALEAIVTEMKGSVDSLNAHVHGLGQLTGGPTDQLALFNYSRKIWSLLKPMDVVSGEMIRVGSDFDGGYIMLNKHLDNALAYSLGIGDDVSWDLALARRGTKVFQFDHTIPHFPLEHENFVSFKLGIAARRDAGENMRTLEDLISQNGHQGRTDLVLKMDIEGAEWRTIEALPLNILGQFSQIVAEFHGFSDMTNIARWNRRLTVLEKLNSVHQCIHVHANNWHSPVMIGGVMMPNLLELTYVRRTDHEFRVCDRVFPTEIDQPGNPYRSDIFLGALGRL